VPESFWHVDARPRPRYAAMVSTTDRLVESLRDLLNASNPGLVTKAELADLEKRVDELLELALAIETRLAKLPVTSSES
jgi:hypothetical protein